MTDTERQERLSGSFETDEHPTDTQADGFSDPTTWFGLTGFKRDCLKAIRVVDRTQPETYGLALKRQLEDWYGQEVNHGRLYPNLDDLVRKGLVEKQELDKRTNEYALTKKGAHLLSSQIRDDVEALGVPVAPVGKPAMTDGSGNGGDF